MRPVLTVFGLLACTPPARPPLDPTEGRAYVLELATAVQQAAEVCTAVARHVARFDVPRADAVVDGCSRALIPARDAVIFGADAVDPWKAGSQDVAGCTGKAVALGLERTTEALRRAGFVGAVPNLMADGIRLGRRLEPYALASCDPLHPTTKVTTYVSPDVAPVEPVPPGVW